MNLTDRVAVVTGGARGIGAGIARCLTAAGARVAIVDVDEAAARETARQLEGSIARVADCSQAEEIRNALEQVAGELGGLDVMVNNAGARIGQPTTDDVPAPGFENLSQESWDGDVQNNLRTTYAGCRAAIPHLKARGGGSIVNVASIAAQMATPQLAAYGAAKAGVLHLTRTLALELGPSNIRVNAICPGLLWTRAWEALAEAIRQTVPKLADASPRDVFLSVVEKTVPLGREQTPEDIGKLTVFLASDDARNITGQEIQVDGGVTLRS